MRRTCSLSVPLHVSGGIQSLNTNDPSASSVTIVCTCVCTCIYFADCAATIRGRRPFEGADRSRAVYARDDQWLWSSNERQLHEEQLHEETVLSKIGVSTDFWIRPATWLHSVHDMAVPISRSLQRSWWGLVLAETRPAQWVTLHNI